MDDIANTLWAGYTHVIDADLSKYFDSIPHAKLMAVVAERIVDGGILRLSTQWLKAPVIGADADGTWKSVGGGKAYRKGTPQGGVISPLLTNCYLHLLDRLWQRLHLKAKLQAHLVRYADDLVVLCRKDVEEPLKVRRGAKIGKPYPNVRPADTSLKKIKTRRTELSGRELTAMPLSDIVGNVSRRLRG